MNYIYICSAGQMVRGYSADQMGCSIASPCSCTSVRTCPAPRIMALDLRFIDVFNREVGEQDAGLTFEEVQGPRSSKTPYLRFSLFKVCFFKGFSLNKGFSFNFI